MVAGAGTVLMTAANGATEELAVEGDSLAALSDGAQYNLTVQVGAVVEGAIIPIVGAEVTIWSVDLTETNDSITLILTKVTTATTDGEGNATFSLAEGDYLVLANYSGLTASGQCTLDADLSGWVLLHNYQQSAQMHERCHCRPPMVNTTA